MLKETFLHSKHKELGAKFTEFGGWDMPVQYTSIIEEHNAVRNSVGIFDTSHMGTFIIFGENAGKFLDYVTISDMAHLPLYKARYSMLLNKQGGHWVSAPRKAPQGPTQFHSVTHNLPTESSS